MALTSVSFSANRVEIRLDIGSCLGGQAAKGSLSMAGCLRMWQRQSQQRPKELRVKPALLPGTSSFVFPWEQSWRSGTCLLIHSATEDAAAPIFLGTGCPWWGISLFFLTMMGSVGGWPPVLDSPKLIFVKVFSQSFIPSEQKMKICYLIIQQ